MKKMLGVPTAPPNSFGGGGNRPITPPLHAYAVQNKFYANITPLKYQNFKQSQMKLICWITGPDDTKQKQTFFYFGDKKNFLFVEN